MDGADTPGMRLRGGAETDDHTIASGSTVMIEFTARLSGQGNKTLRVFVYDQSEPYTWRTDNRAQSPVNVRQPAWQPYAIAASVIGMKISSNRRRMVNAMAVPRSHSASIARK